MSVAAAEALIDACLFQPDQLPAAMESAARLLDFDYFCLVAADLTQPRFIASERQREGVAAYFSGGWADVDYRVHAEHSQPIGTLYLDHVAAGAEHRLSSTVYNEFYRPNDMANYAGIRFEIDGQQWFCSASRGEARGEIDGAEAEAFARVARTSMRVASLSARLDRSRARGLLEGLEASRTAAIVLDQDGRVSVATSAAEALFDDGFGVKDRRLRALDPDDAAALDRVSDLARTRLAYAPGHSFLVRGRGHARPVLVNASRIAGSGLDALPGARVLLVLTDMGARDRVMAADLCRLFLLTPAEADVVMQFTEGRSIPQIAVRRRVVEATIREQMKSVYRKTGVTRQVDLVRLLERLQR